MIFWLLLLVTVSCAYATFDAFRWRRGIGRSPFSVIEHLWKGGLSHQSLAKKSEVQRRYASAVFGAGGIPWFFLLITIILAVATVRASFANESELPLEGHLSPESRAYLADPGELEIKGHTMRFSGCESARFEVLTNERRSDFHWLGQSRMEEMARPYALLAILISNGTNCEAALGQVWEFRVPADNHGELAVTIFRNRKDYLNGDSDSWGIYSQVTPNKSLERTRDR
jgi:hypothetical protein